jgi:hypothetical protein
MEFEEYQKLLNLETAQHIGAAIGEYKRTYGAEWFKQFKEKNPHLVFIVDIVANYNFDDAILKLKSFVFQEIDESTENYFAKIAKRLVVESLLTNNRKDLSDFHSHLKAEIDKPRF